MLGLGSLEAALAVWLCLAAALLCVVYGALNWYTQGKPDIVREERTVVVRDPKAESSGRHGEEPKKHEGQGNGT
jgi:hypothetical protein